MIIMKFVDNIEEGEITEKVHCPTCTKTGSRSNIINHMKRFHGPTGFSWVCGVCHVKHCHYFIDPLRMLSHWHHVHPHIKSPRDLLHPKLGRHHSLFPYLYRPTGATRALPAEDNDSDDYVSDSDSD